MIESPLRSFSKSTLGDSKVRCQADVSRWRPIPIRLAGNYQHVHPPEKIALEHERCAGDGLTNGTDLLDIRSVVLPQKILELCQSDS